MEDNLNLIAPVSPELVHHNFVHHVLSVHELVHHQQGGVQAVPGVADVGGLSQRIF